MPRATLAERFWLRVDKRGAAQCWPWKGAINRLGYGTMGRGKGKHDRAHRVSYEVNVGPIPEGMHILHSCDNRACVNPAHLRIGSHAENMQDMRERDRQNVAKGERCHLSKLTDAQVISIRARRAAGARPVDLIREFGLSKSTLWQLLTRRTWRHLP